MLNQNQIFTDHIKTTVISSNSFSCLLNSCISYLKLRKCWTLSDLGPFFSLFFCFVIHYAQWAELEISPIYLH